MQRVRGLHLADDECERLAPRLHRAARLLAEHDDHAAADDVARLAAAMAAVVAAHGRRVADACPPEPEPVTLAAWASAHGIPATTARRWARSGVIAALKVSGSWMIRDRSQAPP